MNVELLAPAGDLEKLKIAYLYGADACYIGGKQYSLRANANNFTIDEIRDATLLAHSMNKKLYVTVNIIFHEEETTGLDEYLKKLDEIGVDAVIASDILVMKRLKELNLKMELHVSTQASILNSYAGLFYKDLGASRLVLAREANLSDIKEIKDKTNLELECFVHGAMCTSFSGRCVLSNYCTNRDSNRGGCAQICRWVFDTDSDEVFSMTPKDLNLIEYIGKMIETGVNSFKVEGRMRGIYYIATVILAYRRIIDMIIDNTLTSKDVTYYLQVLNRCANRESTPQFINGLPGVNEQYFLGRDEVSNQDFLGIVLAYDEYTKYATIEQRNYFKVGDIVEFFGPNIETFSYQVHNILDENNEEITVANHPRMIIKLKIDKILEKYDMMRIKVIDKQ
jgi:putative protease